MAFLSDDLRQQILAFLPRYPSKQAVTLPALHVVNEHLRFYAAANDTVDYARRIQADYAWLPIGLPAVKTLEAEGWSLAFKGPVSVILRAPGHAVGVPRVVDRTAVREFPGP